MLKLKTTLFAVVFALAIALGAQHATYAAGPTTKTDGYEKIPAATGVRPDQVWSGKAPAPAPDQTWAG